MMPHAMLQILLIALCVNFVTNLLRRKMLSPRDLAKMMESRQYKKMLIEAQKKGDQKALQKLMKKREYYQKIDAEVGKKNLLLLLGSLGIFYAAYALLAPIYGPLEFVAMLPGDLVIPLISHENKLTFIGWFILSLLAVNMPLGKVFEVKPEEVAKHAEENVSNKE